MNLSDEQRQETLKRLQGVFQESAITARQTLAQLMHRDLSIEVAGLRELPFEEVTRYRFPEDVPVAMILLRLLGDQAGEGFLVFVMFEESAKKVNEILWEEIPETTEVLNLSNISALKEMGNIVGSCFLNQLADSSGVGLRPSEPLFVYDLMAAMMEALLLEQSLASDQALLIDTEIKSSADGIAFDVIFLPTASLVEKLYHGFFDND